MMKNLWLSVAIAFVLILISVAPATMIPRAYGQDKPNEIALTEIDQLKIGGKLKDLALIESQLQTIQLQAEKLQRQFESAKSDAQKFVESLFAENKLDRKEWDLDLQTMKFIRKAKAEKPNNSR